MQRRTARSARAEHFPDRLQVRQSPLRARFDVAAFQPLIEHRNRDELGQPALLDEIFRGREELAVGFRRFAGA